MSEREKARTQINFYLVFYICLKNFTNAELSVFHFFSLAREVSCWVECNLFNWNFSWILTFQPLFLNIHSTIWNIFENSVSTAQTISTLQNFCKKQTNAYLLYQWSNNSPGIEKTNQIRWLNNVSLAWIYDRIFVQYWGNFQTDSQCLLCYREISAKTAIDKLHISRRYPLTQTNLQI